MGHYASEMDPDWGRHIDQTHKMRRLRESLRGVPLSQFKAEDVPHLATLFSFIGLPSEAEAVEHLEQIYGTKPRRM